MECAGGAWYYHVYQEDAVLGLIKSRWIDRPDILTELLMLPQCAGEIQVPDLLLLNRSVLSI